LYEQVEISSSALAFALSLVDSFKKFTSPFQIHIVLDEKKNVAIQLSLFTCRAFSLNSTRIYFRTNYQALTGST
jgi:hypothetical protein